MFVTVIHHITDPEGFQAAEANALEGGLPTHVALPIHAATQNHTVGVCIWEGESVRCGARGRRRGRRRLERQRVLRDARRRVDATARLVDAAPAGHAATRRCRRPRIG